MPRLRIGCVSTLALMLIACGGGSPADPSGGNTTPGGGGGSGSGGGGSGSGSSAFYLPYVATSTSGGETGLFVVPSDNLSTTPIFVTRTTASAQGVEVLAHSDSLTRNSAGVVTSAAPYGLLYAAVGSDGNFHIYALRLGDTSVAPAAIQASSLSLAALTDICRSSFAQTNLYDPTTLFVVLDTNVGGTSSCGNGNDVYQVVRYTDSSTSAPAVVNITTPVGVPNPFVALYQSSGALGGLVMLDSSSSALKLYSDATFTNSSVLVSSVTSWYDLVDDSSVNGTASQGASTAFLLVATGGGSSIWRVTATGAASSVYATTGTVSAPAQSVADANNVYFMDTDFQGGTQTIVQEAIGGGTPIDLYSAPIGGLPVAMYSLVGSNGTSLVLTSTTTSLGGVPTTSVLTLPVGTPGTPTNIAGPFSGLLGVTATMCPEAFGDVASDDLLLTTQETTTSGSATTYSYASEVLTPAGAVKQAALANSAFLVGGLSGTCGAESGSVLQARGITDTNGGYGGATVSAFELSSLTTTGLTTTTGSGTYLVPTGYALPPAMFLSGPIGADLLSPVSGRVSAGIAFDVSKGLIVSVSVPNSSVSVE